MIRLYVEGIGLCGPGLNGWAASVPVLAGMADYVAAPVNITPCPLLPANERRRAPKTVGLALAVAAEALSATGRSPAATPMVFTSSGGEGETIHDILTTLASKQRELSPTRFHNSVHNAAAGYWSIATGATSSSTSLCAYNDSFAAGLLEAAAQVASGEAVALVAYDIPYPAPLCLARAIGAAFGVALVLSPEPSARAVARLDLLLQPRASVPSTMAPPLPERDRFKMTQPCVTLKRESPSELLESLRQSTPTARSLPLLAALAAGVAAVVALDYLHDMTILLELTPRPAHGWSA